MISAATLGVSKPSFLSLRGISYRSATAVLSPVWTEPLSNAAGVLLSGETERIKYQIHVPMQAVF